MVAQGAKVMKFREPSVKALFMINMLTIKGSDRVLAFENFKTDNALAVLILDFSKAQRTL